MQKRQAKHYKQYFVYNEASQLIGEYDQSGNPIQETVWFQGMPIAVVKDGVVYNIHTDHLNTPRVITTAQGTIVWQ